MLLYLIRHGDPIYVTDTLTDRGREQAEAVSKRIAASGITRIFSSPMGRARETAAPACRLLGMEAQIEPWAREIEGARLTRYPDGERKSISRLPSYVFREKGNAALTYEHSFECTGVNDTDMEAAVAFIETNGNEFLERLGYRKEGDIYRILTPNEEKVALFCHSAMTRAWLSSLLHVPLHLVWSCMDVTHTGVTVLEFKNYESGITSPRMLCLSDLSHLYAEGLDLRYNGTATEL